MATKPVNIEKDEFKRGFKQIGTLNDLLQSGQNNVISVRDPARKKLAKLAYDIGVARNDIDRAVHPNASSLDYDTQVIPYIADKNTGILPHFNGMSLDFLASNFDGIAQDATEKRMKTLLENEESSKLIQRHSENGFNDWLKHYMSAQKFAELEDAVKTGRVPEELADVVKAVEAKQYAQYGKDGVTEAKARGEKGHFAQHSGEIRKTSVKMGLKAVNPAKDGVKLIRTEAETALKDYETNNPDKNLKSYVLGSLKKMTTSSDDKIQQTARGMTYELVK